jgi:hypothetical protein
MPVRPIFALLCAAAATQSGYHQYQLRMKLSEGLQKLLSFGYLFLIITGILKESIYYHQLGINILNYSTITDVLISPIADLTAHPIILVAVLCLLIMAYLVPVVLSKGTHRKWVRDISGLRNREPLTKEEHSRHFTNLFVKVVALVIFSFFLGIGLGTGEKTARKMATGQLVYNRRLNFGGGEVEDVCLVGSNSLYYFYVSKGKPGIRITPVGAIKTLEYADPAVIVAPAAK